MLHDIHEVLGVLASSAGITGVSLTNTGPGNRVRIRYQRDRYDEERECALLVKSSDWYRRRLNIYATRQGIQWIVCATHDSCVGVSVWCVEEQRLYLPGETRVPLNTLTQVTFRRSRAGHALFVGALLSGKKEALMLLGNKELIPISTRYRIQAEIRALARLRPGHRYAEAMHGSRAIGVPKTYTRTRGKAREHMA